MSTKVKSLYEIVDEVYEITKQPFKWSELDKAMIELHARLSEPQYAIEDNYLRNECEKMLVSYMARKFMEG